MAARSGERREGRSRSLGRGRGGRTPGLWAPGLGTGERGSPVSSPRPPHGLLGDDCPSQRHRPGRVSTVTPGSEAAQQVTRGQGSARRAGVPVPGAQGTLAASRTRFLQASRKPRAPARGRVSRPLRAPPRATVAFPGMRFRGKPWTQEKEPRAVAAGGPGGTRLGDLAEASPTQRTRPPRALAPESGWGSGL